MFRIDSWVWAVSHTGRVVAWDLDQQEEQMSFQVTSNVDVAAHIGTKDLWISESNVISIWDITKVWKSKILFFFFEVNFNKKNSCCDLHS
jgi:hypothetical protein